MAANTATLFGVGVGPGDPDLLTLKAARLIQRSAVVAYLTNLEGQSRARTIARELLSSGQREIPIPMTFQSERQGASTAYDKAALEIAKALDEGHDVAVLCEGDPLLFGSFSYLHHRLAGRFNCVVIPGITSISGAAAAAGAPLASGNESLAIIPATAHEARLRHALESHDTVVIMKPGPRRPRILALLRETGRFQNTVYVEQATLADQRLVRALSDLEPTPGPYFALFLVTRGNTP